MPIETDHHAGCSALLSRTLLVLLLIATGVGGWLRFAGLGSRDFWYDESCTFIYVHDLFDWPEESSLLIESTNLPYYILLRGWTDLFGESEPAFRSMSALAAMLTILVLGLLGRRIGGARVAVVAVVLVAMNPLHVYYAHEARAYALWVLILSVDLWLLFNAARQNTWRWWVGFGAASLVCLHLHYYTVFWMAGTLACVLVAKDRRRVLTRWVVTATATGLAFLPYFLIAVLPAAGGGGSAWIAPSWDSGFALLDTFRAFLPAGPYPLHLRGLSLGSTDTIALGPTWLAGLTQLASLVIVLVVLVAVVLRAAGFSPREPALHKDARILRDVAHGNGICSTGTCAFLVAMTVIPPLGAWIYSLVAGPIYLAGRYDLVAWPAFMLLVAVGINRFAESIAPRRSTWIVAGLTVALLVCSVVPLARMATPKLGPSSPRLRADRVAELTSAGDLVITLNYDREYLLYYLHRAGFEATVLSYPSWLDAQIGWVDSDADLARGERVLIDDARSCVARFDQTTREGGRVFLLADSLDPSHQGERREIHRHLFETAQHAGYEPVLLDEENRILELRRE